MKSYTYRYNKQCPSSYQQQIQHGCYRKWMLNCLQRKCWYYSHNYNQTTIKITTKEATSTTSKALAMPSIKQDVYPWLNNCFSIPYTGTNTTCSSLCKLLSTCHYWGYIKISIPAVCRQVLNPTHPIQLNR